MNGRIFVKSNCALHADNIFSRAQARYSDQYSSDKYSNLAVLAGVRGCYVAGASGNIDPGGSITRVEVNLPIATPTNLLSLAGFHSQLVF
jgi:hypothetical protein